MAGDPRIEVCGEAEDIAGAIHQVRVTRPDLVVLELALKASQGLDLIFRLAADEPAVRVLVWSTFAESLYAERALRAGAVGYISKRESVEEVVRAIRQVLRGQTYLSPRMTARLVQRSLGRRGSQVHALETLSGREPQVFELLGQGLPTQAIARQLELSVKTVASYRDKIRHKLGVRTAAELLHLAIAWARG